MGSYLLYLKDELSIDREGGISLLFSYDHRPVAQLARAPDSKSGGWGFESLQACLKGEKSGKCSFFGL